MSAAVSDPSASWRSELLSEAHGLATIAVAGGRVQDANAAARRLFGDACVGMDVAALFDPEGARRLSELVSNGRAATIELVVRPAGDLRRSFLVLGLPGVTLLVTQPIPGEAELEGERVLRPSGIVEAARQPELISEGPRAAPAAAEDATMIVTQTFAELPAGDVSTLLYTLALEARALVHADYVALGIGGGPDRPFDPWVSVGVSRETAERIGRGPRPVGLLGVVAREGQIVRTVDLNRDPRTKGLPEHHPRMTAFLGVPIRYRGRAVGNLYLANRPGHPDFSDSDERRIRALATSAGAAIESAFLYVAEKRQRSWLRNVIEQMPHAVLLYDERGKLVASNQACAALCSGKECVDKYGNPLLLDIRAPDGSVLPVEELPMTRAFETHAPTFRQEAALRQRDGRMVPVSISAVPVRDPDGTVTGVATVIEDISEHKSVERMREEWAAIIAHDLRQPVGVISLAADLLLKLHAAEWSDRDRKIVDRIRSASGHLARMISDLTDASLIESRQLSLQREVVSMDALVHSVVESLDAVAAGFKVRVGVEGEREAWVDADRIRQVLGNLVSNAAKYGRPGTEIRIDVLGGPDVVELIVTNHGAGIPPDQVANIFSRFERTRGARQSKTAGLGLGLYIAKGVVEAHGGRIWAESIPDETTSFHVVLPRAERPEEDASPALRA